MTGRADIRPSAVICSFGSACVLAHREHDLTNLSESVISNSSIQCVVDVEHHVNVELNNNVWIWKSMGRN